MTKISQSRFTRENRNKIHQINSSTWNYKSEIHCGVIKLVTTSSDVQNRPEKAIIEYKRLHWFDWTKSIAKQLHIRVLQSKLLLLSSLYTRISKFEQNRTRRGETGMHNGWCHPGRGEGHSRSTLIWNSRARAPVWNSLPREGIPVEEALYQGLRVGSLTNLRACLLINVLFIYFRVYTCEYRQEQID